MLLGFTGVVLTCFSLNTFIQLDLGKISHQNIFQKNTNLNYPSVGILNSGSWRIPVGQRVVVVFIRV